MMIYDNTSIKISNDSVRTFIKRVILTFILLMLIGIIFVVFLVYRPMKRELQVSLISNFSQLSHVNYHSLDNNIQRSIEGAKSLSSRTMIKNAIEDYLNGDITFSELQEYTQPKYEDGAIALEYLVSAKRYIGDMLIAEYEPNISGFDINMPVVHSEDAQDVTVKIFLTSDHVYTVILSPVVQIGNTLAYDRLVFDLTSQMKLLCTNAVETQLMENVDYENLVKEAAFLYDDNDMSVSYKTNTYYVTDQIQDGVYFVSSQSKSTLFTTVNRLSLNILIAFSGIFLCFILIVYVYIVHYAKTKLTHLESSHTVLETIAYMDQLTKVYNRQYLSIWNKNLRSPDKTYLLFLIDVDNMKMINDQFGHTRGDSVLKALAAAVSISIRQDDLFFRYGGDEFLLILADIDEQNAKSLMRRIETNLNASELQISISYGMSNLDRDNDFEETIRLADEQMYEHKKRHRAQQENKNNSN